MCRTLEITLISSSRSRPPFIVTVTSKMTTETQPCHFLLNYICVCILQVITNTLMNLTYVSLNIFCCIIRHLLRNVSNHGQNSMATIDYTWLLHQVHKLPYITITILVEFLLSLCDFELLPLTW